MSWIGHARATGAERAGKIAAVAATAMLLAGVGWFVFLSRSWPLVNDAALMHYVVFLMRAGMAPYRDIGDINLPGAYAPEWLSMQLAAACGAGEAGMWRAMDAGLLLLAAAAMIAIARPWCWFAGLFSGSLFALYHARDGIGQAGQRDLWIALLLLWSVALLLGAMRQHRQGAWRILGFGILVGAATTIKPFAAVFLLLLIPALWGGRRAAGLLWAGLGLALPLLAGFFFLLRWHAVGAFWRVLRIDLPYHAALARGSLADMVVHSVVRSLGELLCFAALASVLQARAGPRQEGGWLGSPERRLLACCLPLGLFSFAIQGKGYGYQRYPLLAFLLLWIALELSSAARSRRTLLRGIGVLGFAFGVLACAPACLRGAAKAHWPTAITAAMEAAMEQARARPGDGAVQCLDSVSGCTDALLHLGLREGTGAIYDEFLFPQTPAPWGTRYSGPAPGALVAPAVQHGQQQFWAKFTQNPPELIVVSAWLFPEGPGEYGKLALWPELDSYLRVHYRIVEQREFPRAENGPMGFRVYLRQDVRDPVPFR